MYTASCSSLSYHDDPRIRIPGKEAFRSEKCARFSGVTTMDLNRIYYQQDRQDQYY